ncbi:MAG: MmgE/PrpD family protein [Pigmentiphaga sp.]
MIGTTNGDMRTRDGEDFARTLARFACSLEWESFNPLTTRAVRSNLFDTLACTLAGSGAQGVAELHALAKEWGGAPQASILVHGDRVPAHHAALVNSTMAHARDYDDTHDAATLHAGVSVVPAALAAAQLRTGVSGAEFGASLAAGLEAVCRLGLATTVSITDSGFMYTALFGYFAATVAAGRVLRLDEQQMVNALGIVYSQAGGNLQVSRDDALTKRMQPGFAAMAGVISARMAQHGIRGPQSTFEGTDGLFRVYLNNQYDPDRLRKDLGQQFEFLRLSYKPYPCCRFCHSTIDAALALRPELAGKMDRIRHLSVAVNRLTYEVVCTPVPVRQTPTTIVQAQFSIPFTLATALLDGTVGLKHFDEAALSRQDIMGLARKVETRVDENIEQQWTRQASPSVVTVELDDGTVYHKRVEQALGHPDKPMSTKAFDEKAIDCLRSASKPLAADVVQTLRKMVDQLEGLEDVDIIPKTLVAVG